MVINVIGGNCDPPVRPTACAVPLDAKFTLSVQALEFPPGGYAGVQSFLDFGADLVYNPTDNPADELTWPDCEEAVVRAEVFGKGWVHACLSGLLVPLPASTYAGNIIDLSLSCSSEPSTSVVKLLPFGNAQAKTNGAVFVLPDGVLVIPKDRAQDVRHAVKELRALGSRHV